MHRDQKASSRGRLHIRSFLRRDAAAALAIERASFDHPWSPEELDGFLRQDDAEALAAEQGDGVVGVAFAEAVAGELFLLTVAVSPRCRRQGIGAQLVNELKSRLSADRPAIRLLVSDTNLAAQLFFRSQGFTAIRVRRGYYDTGEDAYEMVYELLPPPSAENELVDIVE